MPSNEKLEKQPYEMLPLADIDGFQFNYEKAMCYLTDKVYKLAAAAKDSSQPRVMWAYTVDGVRVSRNVTLVVAGLTPKQVST
jgi:hypothetical protein